MLPLEDRIEKIALLLDNASVHKTRILLNNIKLIFLLANTTSKLQDLDVRIIDNFKAHFRAQQYDRALCLYISKKLDNPNVYKMDQAQAMVFLANEWLKVKPEAINGMLPDLPRNFDNKFTDVSQLNLEADESEMIVCYTTSTTNNEETAEGNIDETEENDNTEQDEQRVDIVECKKRLREAYETIFMYEIPLDDLNRKLHSRIRMRLAELNKSKEQTDLRSYFINGKKYLRCTLKQNSERLLYIGKMVVEKVADGFCCPVCDRLYKSTVGFRNHLAVHGLCISLPADQKIIHPSNSSGGNSSDDLVESGKLSAHDIAVPASEQFDGASATCLTQSTLTSKKRKWLDYESTILATCDALTETEETKVDKLSIARLGRWAPITLSAPARQYHFLASPTTASAIMEDPDAGMWYMPLRVSPSHSFEAIDGDILLQAALMKLKMGKHLLRNRYVEFTKEDGVLLNKDWLLYPEMRYVCSQLLAGAILDSNSQFLLVNTVEPYGRYALDDAHHERRFTPASSTFPTSETPYGYVHVVLLLSMENGQNKLHISSRACDLLITSSLRIDQVSVNLGPETSHFTLCSGTRIFLDKKSRQQALDLMTGDHCCESQTMPFLYQLKQIRSKFHHLSTYTRCRASSDFGSRLEFQPCTIWTLSDQDSTQHSMSQEKLTSMVFQKIATQVVCNGVKALIKSDDLETIRSCTTGTTVDNFIRRIQELGNELQIIGNVPLNNILTDMTGLMTSGLRKNNDRKIEAITKEAYQC
ncbi:hypothetical protein G6F46_010341 [Rhizopus delemar]|nr:hypothetical protein G6F53_010474 [Rhizopus delemar]KAG1537576.1 hypothetical protein G6F51_010288 [Rhizopus arrhizus]KAG1565148.1 hypothetical protein G6F50_010343 [Rhizopus delemar]KAG1587156.1 hypothetical protein G6F47_011015 [Rhizopus delemar]KAG1610021.1 hypothetical protein G6F46_010341 [Rhizopus delemar]